MTEVIEFFCKTCKKKYGPFGMHGASVEILMKCIKCKDFFVSQKGDTFCPKCKTRTTPFDGKCPECNSKNIFYRDQSMPDDFEEKE